MPKLTHTYSRATTDLTRLLGAEIAVARKERGWTAADLAERLGVTAVTLRNIERGEPNVRAGLVFEALHLLGVPLAADSTTVAGRLASTTRTLSLLPRRVRKQEVDDDF